MSHQALSLLGLLRPDKNARGAPDKARVPVPGSDIFETARQPTRYEHLPCQIPSS
jgi:hypothetical protein